MVEITRFQQISCCINSRFFADFRNFFPKGLLAVALINFGVDLITDFPMESKVRNNQLKTPPIPLPLCIRTPLRYGRTEFILNPNFLHNYGSNINEHCFD